MFPRIITAVSVAALAIGGSTACATKKFVRTSVGEVNQKVDSLGRSVEETQERTRQNESKINEVDQRAQAAAQAAAQSASKAGQAAQVAQTTANQANDNANQAANIGREAGSKADAVDRAVRRVVFEVVLNEDQGNFKFGKTDLPDEAKTRLDELITQIKADPKGAYFEIEGHTDNVGDKTYNEQLGLERAETVKRYLYQQHEIPLHKINVISYGMEKPVAPNKTREGRAQNRRVVIRMLT